MVAARISLRGRPSMSKARAVMSRARVESSPPDSPTTAQEAPVCSSRFHMSMYGVNGSIPKTLVRHLTAHAAAQAEESDPELAAVLRDILDTPVR